MPEGMRGDRRPFQPVMDEEAFADRTKEVLESVIESRTPALVTRGGKLAAIIVPYTMQDVAENLLLDPEVRRSLEGADQAFLEGRTRPSSEALAEDDKDPFHRSLENISVRRENLSQHQPSEVPPILET
ncbi:MAG TPA: hypothetical protein VLF39_03360 [Candidatus Saccharimonadales bacterium]|nr:hypothetical protein [Candidatus Saccharimonadales bacterium]